MELYSGNTYLWSKVFHLLFVVSWMACVFYLPRILVNLAETRDEPAVQARLGLMGLRLYRFGHVMFGLMLVLGLLLWFGYVIDPALWPPVAAAQGWMHPKFLLVLVLLGHFIWSGLMLKRIIAGGASRSSRWLRWFNEVPVVLLLIILWLAIIKPF